MSMGREGLEVVRGLLSSADADGDGAQVRNDQHGMYQQSISSVSACLQF